MRAYRVELDPNNKQRTLFRRCAGATRFVFNWGLATWKQQYEDGLKPSAYGLCVQFNAIKREQCPWITSLPYAVTEAAFQNLKKAFDNFFRRVKQGADKAGYPKFKKRSGRKRFSLRSTKIERDRVRLTGIGWVRLKQADYIPTNANYGVCATISERAGRWYIAVLVTDAEPPVDDCLSGVLGVDFGIKSLAVVSDGTVFENPRALNEYDKKLRRISRELNRRTLGGKNRETSKARLARVHAKIADMREFSLHQISDYVTEKCKPAKIVLEDLNVSGMMKNHHLARAISDVGFSELRRQIEYKAARLGIEIVLADMWYPSSKTCSGCGWKNDALTLADREFKCPQCGLALDRDLNAARNLAAYGLNRQTDGACLGS